MSDPKEDPKVREAAVREAAVREAAVFDEDPDAPPSEEEIAESNRLREALEDPGSDHRDVQLMRALKLAVDPKPLEAQTHRRILDRTVPLPKQRHAVYWLLGGLAAAAGIVLAVQSLPQMRPTRGDAALVKILAKPHQSTEAFPKEGAGSVRVDTILASRARELRHNRYAKWGVR